MSCSWEHRAQEKYKGNYIALVDRFSPLTRTQSFLGAFEVCTAVCSVYVIPKFFNQARSFSTILVFVFFCNLFRFQNERNNIKKVAETRTRNVDNEHFQTFHPALRDNRARRIRERARKAPPGCHTGNGSVSGQPACRVPLRQATGLQA